ncbi:MULTISPECIES: HNH endonuclease [Corynebacterium]|uniref:HNH endonuclease n=1 Tax=Corynebacterium TaxID=1716 RepID=UPI00124C5249|nr:MULTISPECIES: HNH endonuclease [Corynebacterium]
MVPPACVWEGRHLHHRQLRSQGGDHTTENLVLLCHACHDWAHKHPALARERGVIVRATQDPAEAPIKYQNGGYTLLGDVAPNVF